MNYEKMPQQQRDWLPLEVGDGASTATIQIYVGQPVQYDDTVRRQLVDMIDTATVVIFVIVGFMLFSCGYRLGFQKGRKIP